MRSRTQLATLLLSFVALITLCGLHFICRHFPFRRDGHFCPPSSTSLSSSSSTTITTTSTTSSSSSSPVDTYAVVVTGGVDKLMRLGGSDAWYHLLERWAFLVDRFATTPELVPSSHRTAAAAERHLYVIFEPPAAPAARMASSFSRLLTAAIVSAGNPRHLFARIIVATATSTSVSEIGPLPRLANTNTDANTSPSGHKTFFRCLEPSWAVDLLPPSSPSAPAAALAAHRGPALVAVLHTVRLDGTYPQHRWFNGSLRHYRAFRAWVGGLCGLNLSLPTEAAARHPLREGARDHLHAAPGHTPLGKMHVRLSKLFGDTPPTPASPLAAYRQQAARRVLVYQRDRSRRFHSLNRTLTTLRHALHGLRWDVRSFVHDERVHPPSAVVGGDGDDGAVPTAGEAFAAPCAAIRAVSEASVLVTPHGFQAVLTLFQPPHAVLVEVHPSLLLKPEVYGFLQAGLARRMGLPRAYFAAESVALPGSVGAVAHRVLPWLAALGVRVDPHLCVHTAVCRFLAKAQDVVLSPALAAEVATYLRAQSQFNSPPALRRGHSWEKPTIDHLYT